MSVTGEHFPGCHPEDAEASREAPTPIPDTEPCWHCGTATAHGGCGCWECMDTADCIPPEAIYHCPVCMRWWAYMTGLNITTITFGSKE